MANKIDIQAKKIMSKIIDLEKFRHHQKSKDTVNAVILKMSEKHAEKFRKLEEAFLCLADSMYNDFKSENMLLGPKNNFLKATLAEFNKEVETLIKDDYPQN
ncbi:hypothetical protein QUF90_23365 [Desulfococcaceae bacterium HSG9]|nr:hypothetical protein [Desulfococcaceae bacterium HSG9]